MISAMDLDIVKELSRLQEKRLALETTTDLTGKCDTLVELDRRVGKLSNEVKSLRIQVDNIEVDDIWERLAQPYRILRTTNQISSLILGLKKLDRICRLIDIDPYLVHSEDRKSMAFIEQQQFTSSEAAGDVESDILSELVQVLDLLAEFESAYKQLEPILSARSDLPYRCYATKVRSLKISIDKLYPA